MQMLLSFPTGADRYVPGAHRVHVALRASGTHPNGHGKQRAAPTANPLKVLGSQAWHVVLRVESANLPKAHISHFALICSAPKLPAAQSAQLEAPATRCPAVQFLLSDVALTQLAWMSSGTSPSAALH